MCSTFIVKPIGSSCNLSCSYCYFQDKDEKGKLKKMSKKNLEIFLNLFCIKKVNNIIWHGGEPLLAGIDFYKQVVKIQSKLSGNKNFLNFIQTNGTLINSDWINFFIENNFLVGVSIDGPKRFHDITRKSKNGKSNFNKTINSINELKNAGILTNVICCISKYNYLHPKEIFYFFVNKGIKKIKFLQVQGRDLDGRLQTGSISGEDYFKFLLSIFDEWVKYDDPSIEVREINSIVSLLLGGIPGDCMFAGKCDDYLTIYSDGSVYACDSLSDNEDMRFGFINDGLKKIKSSKNFRRFRKRTEEIRRSCMACYYFKICRGGCLQDWWPDIYKKETKNYFCSGMNKLFVEIEKKLNSYNLIEK